MSVSRRPVPRATYPLSPCNWAKPCEARKPVSFIRREGETLQRRLTAYPLRHNLITRASVSDLDRCSRQAGRSTSWPQLPGVTSHSTPSHYVPASTAVTGQCIANRNCPLCTFFKKIFFFNPSRFVSLKRNKTS